MTHQALLRQVIRSFLDRQIKQKYYCLSQKILLEKLKETAKEPGPEIVLASNYSSSLDFQAQLQHFGMD